MKAPALILTLLLLALSCTFDSIGGSETTNGVMARIVYPDGTPAAGSAVRLRRADYVSDISVLSKKSKGFADMITDSQGRFIIDEIDTGDYCVEISNTGENPLQGGAVLLKFTIANDRDTVNLGTEILLPFASLLGEINSATTDYRRLFAQIRGLERITEVAADGTFSFDDLPAGTHSVRIVDSSSALVKEVQNVQTSPGGTFTVKITESSNFSSFIQINTSYAGISSSGVIENFPLLVRLESPAFDFSKAHAAGNDIRFSKIDGQSLLYEIEEWDPLLRKAAVWVLMDSIRGGVTDQFIVMSWGTPGASSLSDGAAVFNTAFGFSGVWHFNEDPSAGSGAIKNRTANVFHGTASSSMTSANAVSGVAGGALLFNGVSDSIEAGLLELNGNYTLSCWVKIDQGPSVNWRFIMKEPAYTLWYDTRWGGFRAEHFVHIADEEKWVWRGIYQDTKDSLPNQSAQLDVWYHLASTWDGGKIRLFINGEIADSSLNLAENPIASEEQLFFGGRDGEFFKGIMDEVRIERVARPAEWIKLCYETQRTGGTVVRY